MALHVISKFLLPIPPKHFWSSRNCCDQAKKKIQEDGKFIRSINKVANRIDLTEEEGNRTRGKTIPLKEPMDISPFSGVPMEHICRMVRIFQPPKNPMQSGTGHIGHWEIEFDARQKWENPNMSWRSGGDPMSNVGVKFSTREQAIDFCEKNGWSWYVWKSFTKKQHRIKRKYLPRQ